MKLIKRLAVISVLFLLLIIVPLGKVSASSFKDTLTFQTIWVTGNKSCYYNDQQRMNEYNELIKLYLSKYGLDYWYYNPECMTEAEYASYQPPDYTDLLIVVYNKNIGRDILHARNMGGFFQWGDQVNKNVLRIETCECLSSKYNDPVWVLSHELSHFTLYYLGFPQEVFADWVHQVQYAYYAYCPDGDITDPRCNGLYTTIEGANRNYQVMAIYQDAYYATPPQKKYVNYVASEKHAGTQQNTNSNESIDQWRLNDIYSSITSQTDSIKKLEEGKETAYRSIQKVAQKYTSQLAKKEIDKAWTTIGQIGSDIGKAKYYLEKGREILMRFHKGLSSPDPYKSNIILTEENLREVQKLTTKSGEGLKEISKLLANAQKLQTAYEKTTKNKEKNDEFCLLSWCIRQK